MSVLLTLAVLVVGSCGSEDVDLILEATSTTEDATTNEDAATSTNPPLTTATPPSTAPTATLVPGTLESWEPAASNLAGLRSECGNLSLVAAHPTLNEVVASVALQGLFAQRAGSDSWEPLGTAAGSDRITNRGSAVVHDPDLPSRYWESGIYGGGGVYRTDDSGQTFVRLGDIAHVDLVSVDVTDPNRATLLAGIHEEPQLWRSTDGGATWTDVSPAEPNLGFASAPHVIDRSTYLLGTKNGGRSGVFLSSDAGSTWTKVHDRAVTGPPIVSATDGALIWLLANGAGLIDSIDSGETWRTVSSGGWIAPGASTLLELPDGRLVTNGGETLVVSADRGSNWQPLGPVLPYTPNGLTYSPSRDAFYAWRFECGEGADVAVDVDSIIRFDVTP